MGRRRTAARAASGPTGRDALPRNGRPVPVGLAAAAGAAGLAALRLRARTARGTTSP